MTSALSMCLRGLSKFLNRINCPIPLKEVVLHLLSDIAWTLCRIAESPEGEGEGSTLYAFPAKFIQSAQQELLKLYSAESSKFSKAKWSESKHCFPPPMSIAAGGLGRYSTYFQALLEFVLAAQEYQHKFHASGVPLVSSSTTVIATGSNTSLVSAGGSSGSNASLSDNTIIAASEAVQENTLAPVPTTRIPGTSSSPTPTRGEISPSTTPPSVAASAATAITDPISGGKKVKRGRSRKGLKKESESSPKKEDWLTIVNQAITLLRVVATPKEACPGDPIQLPNPVSSTHPSSRLVVLVGIAPALTLEATEAAIKKVCKRYGGLYRDDLYLPSNDSNHLQHCGYAVLELCCDSHTSAVCSALLDTPALQQEEVNMQALAVTNSFSCGSEEHEAQKVLVTFLRSRLTAGDESGSAAAALADIFRSSCPEEGAALSLPSVSGLLLKFLACFAELCAVSAENFMAGLWDEFGEQGSHLNLEGFRKCYQQDFMLNDEFAARGVWLGLIGCGYDLHLERYDSIGYVGCVVVRVVLRPLRDISHTACYLHTFHVKGGISKYLMMPGEGEGAFCHDGK
jgi:hypothetical protein